MDVAGKTALVTGGAQRVGKAISLALARAGANVVVNYHRSAEAAQATAAEARALGVEALAVQADVAELESVQALVARAEARFGGVDVLVNNASLFQKTPFPTDDLTAWQRVTGVLIHGAFYCANAVAPGMLARGDGAIVNIADVAAWQPWPNFAAHCVGKAALLALTRQLALELAPAVRANAVAPGLVLPPPNLGAKQIQRLARRTLFDRWGTPEDVAQAALFLVQADYITGEVITVDGGGRLGGGRG
ncbi:MAG: SDR family NAD(P)-dependent oxidoreductase [Anaerolineae bacterium]